VENSSGLEQVSFCFKTREKRSKPVADGAAYDAVTLPVCMLLNVSEAAITVEHLDSSPVTSLVYSTPVLYTFTRRCVYSL
jgi:hypothetical protein